MKAKHDDLVEALDGMFDDHHGELAELLLDQITSLDAKIARLGARAAELAAAMPAAWGVDADGTTGVSERWLCRTFGGDGSWPQPSRIRWRRSVKPARPTFVA
jgi:hypothetical protein